MGLVVASRITEARWLKQSDDHDYGVNNSDRTQPGKERALRTFFEIWANPPVQTGEQPGIWTRFAAGQCEFWLLDGRYHRSPNDDPDGPNKTMLGMEQRAWFTESLASSEAVFKFPVSGSSWHCGGKEAWNHQFLYEYDTILSHVRAHRVSGLILLGGDQHVCKVSIRPRESWGGYDLHEWMAGRLVNPQQDYEEQPWSRGFGLVTVNTEVDPPATTLEFFNDKGKSHAGTKIPYTAPGALRALWDSPAGAFGRPPRSFDGELRPLTSAEIWGTLPTTTGYTIPLTELQWPKHGWEDRRW
ncbi:MAG: alkaline phosphatase D family protein [Phycisphaeraceae bacterium]|nr:alkaline phosphatase D family protein [Phycisphaeraceae bacterium]